MLTYFESEDVELQALICLKLIIEKILSETPDLSHSSTKHINSTMSQFQDQLVMKSNGVSSVSTSSADDINAEHSSLIYTTVDLDPHCSHLPTCGLQNLGNTCFMNSILQCFINIPPLVQYYLRLKNEFSSMRNNSMSKAFIDLIESMQRQNVVRPNELKSALCQYASVFQGYGQQDAHECLTVLLDALHQESSKKIEDNEERSIITDLCQGQMEYTIRCSHASQCGNVTVTTDPFFDLPLFIESKSSKREQSEPRVSRHSWLFTKANSILGWNWFCMGKCHNFLRNRFPNLHRRLSSIILCVMFFCFRLPYKTLLAICHSAVSIFTSDLTLKRCLINNISIVEHSLPNNMWFCSQCKQNRQLTKENRILSLPQLLIIHLKRFDMESPGPRSKIETFVKYPLELDMTEFLSEKSSDKQIYDLTGVCLHFGSFEGGHYIGYAKKTSGWFCFNDSSVIPIVADDVVSKNAYILFYLKRD